MIITTKPLLRPFPSNVVIARHIERVGSATPRLGCVDRGIYRIQGRNSSPRLMTWGLNADLNTVLCHSRIGFVWVGTCANAVGGIRDNFEQEL